MSATTTRSRLERLDRAGLVWTDARQSVVRSADALGRPGPWRVLPTGAASVGLVFDCPDVSGVDAAREDAVGREVVARWARATALGRSPRGWRAPERDVVEEWVDPGALSIGVGEALVRGHLECAPKRLRVSCSGIASLDRLDDDVERAARAAWLEAICLDATARWQLVRFGLGDTGVDAEVDLTGVPESLATPLVRRGVAALAASVRWILPIFERLTDPAFRCVALEGAPPPRAT